MDDRTLLELAAKAAGHEVWTDIDGNLYTTMNDLLEKPWNPLTDDGDALRLAVKLGVNGGPPGGLYVEIRPKENGVEVWVFESRGSSGVVEYGDDPYAATRRAIVRAAAEIGRAMP